MTKELLAPKMRSGRVDTAGALKGQICAALVHCLGSVPLSRTRELTISPLEAQRGSHQRRAELLPVVETPEVAPITDSDIPKVADFLHRLNPEIPLSAWQALFRPPWQCEKPNNGFMSCIDGRVVGVYGAVYSEREIAGSRERFCHLTSWFVEPAFRNHSLLLTRELLRQRGFHFTNLTPTVPTAQIFQGLRFRWLESRAVVIPNVLIPWPKRCRIVDDIEELAGVFQPKDRKILEDHRSCSRIHQLGLVAKDGYSHIIYRGEKRKRLPVGNILYASNAAILSRCWGNLTAYLLLRHGYLLTLVEARLAQPRPRPSFVSSKILRRMYLSKTLRPEQIDNLYTDLMLL